MRFILLTYNDSRHGRIGCMMVHPPDGVWSVLDGVACRCRGPKWAHLTVRAAMLALDPAVEVRTLDMPDDEPMHGDGEALWNSAEPV